MDPKFNAMLKAKANIPLTLAIACLASLVTTVLLQGLAYVGPGSHSGFGIPIAPIAKVTSVLECETGVYSPVQRVCVTQAVFDAEMTKLFAALGLDTSIYMVSRKPEND